MHIDICVSQRCDSVTLTSPLLGLGSQVEATGVVIVTAAAVEINEVAAAPDSFFALVADAMLF